MRRYTTQSFANAASSNKKDRFLPNLKIFHYVDGILLLHQKFRKIFGVAKFYP